MNGAKKAGYTVPENPMVLDTGGMFLGNIMVEVQGANEGDKNVVSFMNKEVYTKASKVDWKDIKKDITALETELGAKPKELYMWYTACPECVSGRECKTILIAVP